MRIIDVTGLIEEGMWTYGPPLPAPRIEKLVSPGGITDYRFVLGSITGTYLETAAHRLPGQPSLDEIPVEKLFVDAVVVRLETKKPSGHVEAADLIPYEGKIRRGDALLVSTGWDRMWNKKGFIPDSPHFTAEAMDWILSKKISILAGDMPCYDDPRASEGLVNKLFRRGLLILAPLVNLRQVPAGRVKLIALPARIKNTCGFPCRAVVLCEETC